MIYKCIIDVSIDLHFGVLQILVYYKINTYTLCRLVSRINMVSINPHSIIIVVEQYLTLKS